MTSSHAYALLYRTALGVLAGLIFVFAWAVVRPYGDFNVTYYDELADAFLAGQLNLLRPPPPAMLALPDPWDPDANREFRLMPYTPGERFPGIHDLTLYDGKLYVQWGPLPALVLIPLRWIAHRDLPMGHLVLVVEMLGALAYAVSTVKLVSLSGLPRSRLLEALVIPLFLLCPYWTFSLRRIAVYECAVFFGQFCIGAALLSTVLAFEARLRYGRNRLWLLALASLLLGGGLACRPELAVMGLVVPAVFYAWWRSCGATATWRDMVVPAMALGGPAALTLTGILAYNAARFGNPFETGPDWILWNGFESIRQHKYLLLAFGRFLPNIWYYLLAPLQSGPDFPMVFGPTMLSPRSWLSPAQVAIYYGYADRTSGLFVVSPLTSFALLSPLLVFKRFRSGRTASIVALSMLAALSSSLLFLSTASMRYGAEWSMWWLLAAILLAFRIRHALRAGHPPVAALAFDVGLVLATLWSGWVGLCFMLRIV